MQGDVQTRISASSNDMMYVYGEMIECYTNEADLQKFSAGYVALNLDNEIILQHLQPNGDYDGYIVINKNNIVKVERNTRYIKKLEKLKEMKKVLFEEISRTSENGFECVLNHALEKKRVVSIQLLDSDASDIVGYVDGIRDRICTVNMLNEYGEADGVCDFFIEDISFISCDGDEERTLDMLCKYDKMML